MSKPPKWILNFDDVETKRRLMQKISSLSGLWEVTLKPRKLTRSLSQNAYYWVAVVTPFTEWLRSEWGDPDVEMEQAHEMLKQKILGGREIMNKSTGEVEMVPSSSRHLDTSEFGIFIDKAAAWLAEFCGIVVLPPEMFLTKGDK